MNIDIRKSVINNFLEAGENEIEEAITSSFQDKEEITLPGLGVFFELLWSASNDETRKIIVGNIQKFLKEEKGKDNSEI